MKQVLGLTKVGTTEQRAKQIAVHLDVKVRATLIVLNPKPKNHKLEQEINRKQRTLIITTSIIRRI
jgi:pseudouridine-5'-phosphate glycosidase